MSNSVALILNNDVTEECKSLIVKMPIWIVETKENMNFVDSAMLQHNDAFITTFARKENEPNTELLKRILYTLDDHHNEHSYEDVYDTLIVFGASLDSDIANLFQDIGFVEFIEKSFGFIASKLNHAVISHT